MKLLKISLLCATIAIGTSASAKSYSPACEQALAKYDALFDRIDALCAANDLAGTKALLPEAKLVGPECARACAKDNPSMAKHCAKFPKSLAEDIEDFDAICVQPKPEKPRDG